MSYVIFGRAVKSEYLTLATLFSTGVIAYAAMSRGKTDGRSAAGTTPQDVKSTVPLNASSTEEEQLMDSIRKYIEEAEKDPKHS